MVNRTKTESVIQHVSEFAREVFNAEPVYSNDLKRILNRFCFSDDSTLYLMLIL